MKRAFLSAGLAILGLMAQGKTVTNTYALVAGWGNAAVNLYKVGDDSLKWTYVRGIRSSGDGTTAHVSDAVRVGDVVYVLDMRDESATSERFIRKYALDGSGYLGDLASLGTDREAGCMCVSSDGQSLYVGYTFRTAGGKVDRVSLADGTVTKDFATGLGEIRQLATDGKGHLFAADRLSALSVVSEANGQVLTTVAGDVSGSQGVAYDPVHDCCWWSREGTTNYGTFTFAEPSTVTVDLSQTDGAWGQQCFAVATLDGLPYFGSFSDRKIYRRDASGTIAAVTDAAGNDFTYPAAVCGLTFFRETVEVEDVARVYVTFPSVGVRTYIVDSQDEWRFEGTFAANAAGKMDHPVAFHKAGDFFYACDQHQDTDLGYFSVSRYDTCGAYRGRLVDKCTLTAPKADNMTVSPDGKYLYVSCFHGGSVLRVSTADGTVESFATDKVEDSRGACVSSDGTLFVANRAKHEATAYDPATGAEKLSYAASWASGVFCDDAEGLVYVTDTGADTTKVFNRDGTDTGVTVTGTGNCMALDKVNGRIIFGNWAGEILSYKPGSAVTAATTVLSGLGNIQHFYVEPLVADTRMRPDAKTISFSAPASGDWYVARDEGLGEMDAAEKTTVWKSSDKGATWKVQGELPGVLRPSVYILSGRTFLVGEKVRAAADGPMEITSYELGGDGTWTLYRDIGTDLPRTPGSASHLCGGTAALPTMFGGVRPFFPVTSGKSRTFSAFSLLDPRGNNPDPCFSEVNVGVSNFFGVATAAWRDAKNPLDAFADATAVALPSGGVATLVPNVPRRTASAERLSQESVLVVTNWFASSAPAIAGWAKLPGGAKPVAAFWDEPSACYWAVTAPETNLTHILVSDPNQTRNVLALYASENLFDWRSAGLIRAEGTPETVAFDRPCAAVDGDDLVLVYKAAGAATASGATSVTADGSLVFQRVADFRARKPSFDKDPEILLSTSYTLNKVDRYVKDPVTGDWQSDGVFAAGPQLLGHQFQLPVGLAVACGRVYVACESIGIFEFSLKGKCRRFFAPPAGRSVDAIVVSADGGTAWVTDCSWDAGAMMKLDLRTGAWTTLIGFEGGCPRALAVAKDGSFYLGIRDFGTADNIRHYAADGSSYETLNLGFDHVVCLVLNETEDVLYCGSSHGRVVKVELNDGNKQTELTFAGSTEGDNGAFSILQKDGRLYCVDGTAAIHYVLDEDAANQLPLPLFGGGLARGRSVFVDTTYRRCSAVILR